MKVPKKIVSVVIPARNEVENLRLLLPRVRKSIEKIKNFKFEVIVVCNNCTDDSVAIVRKNHFTVIEVKFKKPNKSLALLTGFKEAKGEILVMMDADVSHLPEDLGKMLKPLKNKKVGLVIASRILGKSDDETLIRKTGGIIFNKLVNLFFETRLTDAINGYKAFKREIYDNFSYNPLGYTIEVELIANTRRSGYKVVEIPSFEAKRGFGKPKSKIIKDGWFFIRKIFEEGLNYSFGLYKGAKSKNE